MGEWIKKAHQLCGCFDGFEPKEKCREERKKTFCNCEWSEIYYTYACKKCGYEPKEQEQDFLPNYCANCGERKQKK